MFDPNPNCVFMINDIFVTRRAFLRAVTPGKRLYCRGNRGKGQFYGVYTTPFYAADGIIDSADGATAKITHTQGYIMCTPPTIQQTVSAAPESRAGQVRGQGQHGGRSAETGASCSRHQTSQADRPDHHSRRLGKQP